MEGPRFFERRPRQASWGREIHEMMGYHESWGRATDQLAALVAKI
jgi:hypothetical protein